VSTITFKRRPRWTDRPLRTCRTLHHCEVCKRDITIGQQYRDGGYGKRAHETCAQDLESAQREENEAEDRALDALVRALRPEPKIHYAGALRIRKPDGVLVLISAGWAACLTGPATQAVRQRGNLTHERDDVTCKRCRALMLQAAESSP
jgi:hypothetical protein